MLMYKRLNINQIIQLSCGQVEPKVHLSVWHTCPMGRWITEPIFLVVLVVSRYVVE